MTTTVADALPTAGPTIPIAYRLGVDTGGTFTDLCLLDERSGRMRVAKVPSTPDDPARAVIQGIQKLMGAVEIEPGQVSFLIHGTTVATNALLEGKGAPTALITTKGFEDVLLIGRQNRPKLYDFWSQRPTPVVPRSLCYGVSERIDPQGETLAPLDETQARAVVAAIKAKGIGSIAVCLLHAYANGDHEQRIKALCAELHPQAFVTISSEVLPEFREYERMSTICINAYVMPRVNAYVAHLELMLSEMGIASDLYIMQSNGGVITARTARRSSARTALSGPAGGALCGVHLAERLDMADLITIDMGGTSSDICLIEGGRPRLTTEADIEGYPIRLPMIDINTIGAGGGSIAWIDTGGALRVGPQSAGAVPGPVCYGRGGELPTVTDANVILGRINPAYLLGGEMQMYQQRAHDVMRAEIADPLGISVTQAAAGVIAVVNANMIRGIRRVSVERGHDPRDFALMPFGGAGPLHGVELARFLNMSRIVVPVHPGIASAVGMLSADVRHDYVRTMICVADTVDLTRLKTLYTQMEDQGRTQLAKEGFEAAAVELVRMADMRYAGQSYELTVNLPADGIHPEIVTDLTQRFHRSHAQAYGYERSGEAVEFVNLRLVALGKLPPSDVDQGRLRALADPKPIARRQVHFDGQDWPTPVYQRTDLGQGFVLDGPAIVEQLDSTLVIPPGYRAHIEPNGNLIIDEEVAA